MHLPINFLLLLFFTHAALKSSDAMSKIRAGGIGKITKIVDEKSIFCPICSNPYKTPNALKRHARAAHCNSFYVCKFCQLHFDDLNRMHCHLRVSKVFGGHDIFYPLQNIH